MMETNTDTVDIRREMEKLEDKIRSLSERIGEVDRVLRILEDEATILDHQISAKLPNLGRNHPFIAMATGTVKAIRMSVLAVRNGLGDA